MVFLAARPTWISKRQLGQIPSKATLNPSLVAGSSSSMGSTRDPHSQVTKVTDFMVGGTSKLNSAGDPRGLAAHRGLVERVHPSQLGLSMVVSENGTTSCGLLLDHGPAFVGLVFGARQDWMATVRAAVHGISS